MATLYMIFAASARKLIASPRVQHVFHIAGGVLHCRALGAGLQFLVGTEN